MKTKQLIIAVCTLLFVVSCKVKKTTVSQNSNEKSPIVVTVDLINVVDDKVRVVMNPGKFKEQETYFYIPQIVPGTYENSNFGRFIEQVKAIDYKGKELAIEKIDPNTWKVSNATQLDRIEYVANDTFDGPEGSKIYPMGGTNFEAGKTFLLNLHSMVGYFKGKKETAYQLIVLHPDNLEGHTSLPKTSSKNQDVFSASRYFQVIDNPILYTTQEAINFQLDDILVNLALYSPSETHKATQYKEVLKTMMESQKKFLGDANATKRYDILMYLMKNEEVQRYNGMGGALEHHTSTTATFADQTPKDYLSSTLVDVISHEFFHTLTPLNIHSEEIHHFEYNKALMSQHLWMYEGTTEYFANLFQVNQGLINEAEFIKRMTSKINTSLGLDDTMSFTEMSKNIVDKPYADNYSNVYMKGALINMCLDIIIREKSNGEKGILWVMKQLAKKYGVHKPFKDDALFDEITALTYPEVKAFFDTHVIGTTPIDYETYFNKVGVVKGKSEATLPSILLASERAPFFGMSKAKDDSIEFLVKDTNSSLDAIGLKKGDKILKLMDVEFNQEFAKSVNEKMSALFGQSVAWAPDTDFTVKVLRAGKEMVLTGKVGTPSKVMAGYQSDENASATKTNLKNSWLKG